MLEIEVGHVWTYLNGSSAFGIIDSVTSYEIHGRWHSKQYQRGQWDGIKKFRQFDRKQGRYKIATGFLSRITAALDAADYPYELNDDREFDPPEPVNQIGDFKIDEGKYDYQFQAVQAACNHGRGIVQAATGAGKSAIGAAIIKTFGGKAVWLTHRVALLHQTRAVLQKLLGQPIGIIGDGEWDLREVTVAMVQTLDSSKYRQEDIQSHLDDCHLVIIDEAHHLESRQFADALTRIPAPHRFGLTATPCVQGPGLSLIGMAGDIIYEIGAQELIQRGVLVPPRIWVLPQEEPAMPTGGVYGAVYARGVVRAPRRNARIASLAKTLKAEGKTCLTLVRQINHGELLADLMAQAGVKAEFITSRVKQPVREKWLEQLRVGEIDHIVAVASIMGEGVDLPWLQALINATATKGGGSKETDAEHEIGRVTLQFIGRGLRCFPGKDFFEYFDFPDEHHKFMKQAAKDRLNTLKENGYEANIKSWRSRELEA